MIKKINTTDSYRIQVVTSIFEIQRELFDGRSVNFYFERISHLLETYPNTIVFHNLQQNLFTKLQAQFPLAQFVFQRFEELPIYSEKSQIQSVINSMRNLSDHQDLVFKNIDYGILINSKPFFMKLASLLTRSDFMLWVDAGISRFYENDRIHPIILKRNVIPADCVGILDIDLKNLMRNYKVNKRPLDWIDFGSSTRIVSGGAFLIRTTCIETFYDSFAVNLHENLKVGLWDTEQVNLFKLAGSHKFYFSTVANSSPISILKSYDFGNWEKLFFKILSGTISKLIS